MSVRRGAARLALFGSLLAGLVLAGAAPAAADDDTVRVRAASSFTTGGSANGVSVSVVKRTDGCVGVRAALAIRLAGLAPEQVQLQVARAGQWRSLTVGGLGVGTVGTGRISPETPRLCKDKSTSLRYRLAFLAGAPAGRATIIAEAYTGTGEVIARASDSTRVVAGRGVATPTASATPTPEPTEPVESVEPVIEAPSSPAAAVPVADETDSGGFFGPGTLVMLVGLGMVGVGAALIVLLLRRNRTERRAPAYAGPVADHLGPGGYPTAHPQPGYPAAPTAVFPAARPGGYPQGSPAGHPRGVPGGHPEAPTTVFPATGQLRGGPGGGSSAAPTTVFPTQQGRPPGGPAPEHPRGGPAGRPGGPDDGGDATRLLPRVPPV